MRSRAAVVALLAVPLVALPYVRANDDAGGGFVFETATRDRIATSIEATGTVEAVETVDVGSEVSGLIAKVFVNFNDAVAAGQPLAELDRAGFKARAWLSSRSVAAPVRANCSLRWSSFSASSRRACAAFACACAIFRSSWAVAIAISARRSATR